MTPDQLQQARCTHPKQYLRLVERWGPLGPLLGIIRCGLCGVTR